MSVPLGPARPTSPPFRPSAPATRRRVPRSPGSTTGAFTARLDREWTHLRRRSHAVRTAREWRRVTVHVELERVLTSLTDLDQVVDATQAGRPDADGILLELVRLARSDELAGRIVVQRLLPALVARAAPYRSPRDHVDPAELAVPAAWIAIRRYDTARRRAHVAPSLVSDAIDQAFRQPLRRRAAGERPAAPASFHGRPAPSGRGAVEELAGVVREAAAAGVGEDDLELVRRLVRVGSPSVLAGREGVTPRTIRNRRDRAVARIRAAVLAA